MFLKPTSPVTILKKKIATCDEKIERFEMNQYPGIKLGIFDQARTDKLHALRLRKNQMLQELSQLESGQPKHIRDLYSAVL